MALPTTNLTFHADASGGGDVWVNYQSTAPYHNTPAGDGNIVDIWDDVEHGGYSSFGFYSFGPTYKVTTPLMPLPCLRWDGTNHSRLMDDPGTAFQPASLFVNPGAKTFIFAIYAESITTNGANNWENQALIAEGGGFFALAVRDAGGGAYKVIAYNYDGNQDSVELPLALNTTTVVTMRHDGTNLYISTDGGAESSVASGDTQNLTGTVTIGSNYNRTIGFVGRIGEVAIWNAALTGTALSDANSYFTSKWLAAAGTTHNVSAAEGTATAADEQGSFLAQFAFPASDIAANGWLPSSGGSLYPMLDEATADFADYIYSPNNPTTQAFEVKLGSLSDPVSSTDHSIEISLVAQGADTNFDFNLVQGTTVLDSWTENVTVTQGQVTRIRNFSGAVADSITDYTDLRLRGVARA